MVVNYSANATFLTIPKFVISLPVQCFRLATSYEYLFYNYTTLRRSPNQIAKSVELSRQTIWFYLKKNNIQLRDNDRVVHNRARAFGRKWRGGKITKDTQEQAIVDKMVALRTSGLSYAEIANVLNNMQISTKKKKKWHLTTKSLLNRGAASG